MRILILCILGAFLATDARSQHSTAFLNITLTDVQSFRLPVKAATEKVTEKSAAGDEDAARVLNLINSQIKRYDSRERAHLVHYKKIASVFPKTAFTVLNSQSSRTQTPATANFQGQPLIIYEVGPR